jgi:Ras family
MFPHERRSCCALTQTLLRARDLTFKFLDELQELHRQKTNQTLPLDQSIDRRQVLIGIFCLAQDTAGQERYRTITTAYYRG